MQVITSTSTPAKGAPIRKMATKPLSKAKVTSVPKPAKTGRGAVRALYKYSVKSPKEAKTPQMVALVTTTKEAKKSELDSSSFTAQDLVALAVKRGTLTTGQDPLRIFRFYAKRLVEEGFFTKI